MDRNKYTNDDWKLFRARIANWQEAYIGKLNEEYIALLSADANPSDKFWELEKRIRQDKKNPGVLIEMRKDHLTFDLASLIQNHVIGLEDIDDFSDALKQGVYALLER